METSELEMTPPDAPKATKEETKAPAPEEDLLGDLFPAAGNLLRPRALAKTLRTRPSTRRIVSRSRRSPAPGPVRWPRLACPNPTAAPVNIASALTKDMESQCQQLTSGAARACCGAGRRRSRQRQITQPTTRPTIRRPCRRERAGGGGGGERRRPARNNIRRVRAQRRRTPTTNHCRTRALKKRGRRPNPISFRQRRVARAFWRTGRPKRRRVVRRI